MDETPDTGRGLVLLNLFCEKAECELLGDEWRGQLWEPKDDVRGGA